MHEETYSEFPSIYMDSIMSFVAPGGIHPKTGQRVDWKNDAGEGAFLERQLEMIEAKVYEYKLRELKFRQVFPISNEGEGSATIAYDIIRNAGVAKIIASGATDIPRADTFIDRHYAVVRTVAISFAYTTQELRHAAFANVPLEVRRGNGARRGIEKKLSDIAWNGDAQYGLLGVLNQPNIPQAEAAAPATGSDRTWAGGDKTPFEVISDIGNAITRVVNTTNQIHEPNTILMPVAQYEYLRKTPYSTQIAVNILSFLTDPKNGYNIDKIEQVPELAGSGPGGEDQMLIYERSDEVLTFRIPMEMKPMPPQVVGLEFKINMEAETAGMVVRYPLAMDFTYGI